MLVKIVRAVIIMSILVIAELEAGEDQNKEQGSPSGARGGWWEEHGAEREREKFK